MVGVGRDLCGSSSPTLLPKQGHLQQAAQDPLLLFHMGGDEVAVRGPRVIKRDFRALGWLVRESEAQVIFSSPFHLW